MNTKLSFLDNLSSQKILSLVQKIVRLFDPSTPLFEEVGKKRMGLLAAKADLDVPDHEMHDMLHNASETITNKIVGFMGNPDSENLVLRGAALGLTAGIGVVLLHDHQEHHLLSAKEKTNKKLMTVGLYVVGGILASIITQKLQKREHLDGSY